MSNMRWTESVREEIAREALPILIKQRDEAQKRCDEAHAALSYAFHALVEISLLTRLGGEVDGYEGVVRAVREVVEERDKLLARV